MRVHGIHKKHESFPHPRLLYGERRVQMKKRLKVLVLITAVLLAVLEGSRAVPVRFEGNQDIAAAAVQVG